MLLTAEFGDVPSTAAAIRAFKARGYDARAIEMFSTEPVELPDGLLGQPSHMPLAAVTSALCFCGLAILFVYYTQHNYPLVTGGMPIFSWWATGVIFYEFTMFGAIFATFVMFLRESGLPRRLAKVPAQPLVEGRIYLRISCDPLSAPEITYCLSQAGALHITELEGT
jgi:hypothetical protein